MEIHDPAEQQQQTNVRIRTWLHRFNFDPHLKEILSSKEQQIDFNVKNVNTTLSRHRGRCGRKNNVSKCMFYVDYSRPFY